jgi:predicted O-methyltransferase YrrM
MWDRTTGRGERDIDPWALHPAAVRFLDAEIRRLVPSYVLEFGSGASTVWMASLMRELHGTVSTRVFSIEQDEATATSVRRDLEQRGLDDVAKIRVAPLVSREVWRTEVTTYGISVDEVNELLGGARPDVVVIDGPAGNPGARFGTLPLVMDNLSPGAVFYLDDALRRGELGAGAQWARSPSIRVAGVHLIGRGMLAGSVGSDA